jgi:quinol monooxygenase YgiN
MPTDLVFDGPAPKTSVQNLRGSRDYNALVNLPSLTGRLSRPRRRLFVELFGDGPSLNTFQPCERRLAMFTRIVECYVKREKRQEFTDKLQKHVLPILQSQAGFVDTLNLSAEEEPERIVAISMWKSRADAERYHRDHFSGILDVIRPLLRDEPTVEFYNVESSTAHRIAAKAA